MSLKLDELRKRLLQQQLGSDGGSPEPVPGTASSKVAGVHTIRSVEALNVSEPPTAKDLPEPTIITKADELPTKSEPSRPASISASEASATPAADRTIVPDVSPLATNSGNSAPSEVPVVREGRSSAAPSAPAVQNELADAVAKVFEQTEAFRMRLQDLSKSFEPIDRMGNSAARAFEPLRKFHDQMAQLARSFEPMRAFQQQLAQLAQTFEPMRALESQLGQLADSFRNHLTHLIDSLEPARQMRERIGRLAATFDQATELQAQFTDLHDAFRLTASPAAPRANGLDTRTEAAH